MNRRRARAVARAQAEDAARRLGGGALRFGESPTGRVNITGPAPHYFAHILGAGLLRSERAAEACARLKGVAPKRPYVAPRVVTTEKP